MTELFTIPRDWDGETCAILGGGPSMSLEVAESVRGVCRVIAVNSQGIDIVNDSGRTIRAVAPWADVLYAADKIFWYNHKEECKKFRGLKLSMMPNGYRDFAVVVEGTEMIGNGGPDGFDDRPNYIRSGHNSGYQALHIAAHFGAKRILLLGFDMKAKGENQHWFGNYKYRAGHAPNYSMFMHAFNLSAHEFSDRGIEVINCTPDSALKCFPFRDLGECLNDVRKMHANTQGNFRAGQESIGEIGAASS